MNKFPEKSVKICCDFGRCATGFHQMFYLTKTIQICKKLAISSNLVVEKKKNDFLITNADDYLVNNKRFVR